MGKVSTTMGAYIRHAAAGTVYTSAFGSVWCSATETEFDVDVHENFTWKNMWLWCDAFTATSTRIRSRINGGFGNLSVVVNGTGEFSDLVNSDAIVAGNDVNLASTQTGAGVTTINQLRTDIEVASVVNTDNFMGLDQASGADSPAGLNGSGLGVELNTAEMRIRHVATARNMRLNVYGHTGAAISHVYFRKNGVNGNPHIAVPASATGNFADDVNTMAVAAGDRCTGMMDVTAVTLSFRGYIVLQNAVDTLFLQNYNHLWQAAIDEVSIYGYNSSIPVSYETGHAGVLKYAGATVRTNTCAANETSTLYNGVNPTAIVITIIALTTGIFEDTVNTAACAATDPLSWYLSARGGAEVLSAFQLKVELLMPVARTKALSADALLEKLGISKAFTSDAILKKSGVSKTLTADAYLEKLGITKILSADGLLEKIDLFKTLIADSLLEKQDLPKTISADALLEKLGVTKVFTSDGLLEKQDIPKTLTSDAILYKVGTLLLSADALLKKLDVLKTLSADGLLEKQDTPKTLTADAYLEKIDIPKSVTADALLLKSGTLDVIADALLEKLDISKLLSADALLQGTYQKILNADALLERGDIPKTFLADGLLEKSDILKALTADGLLEKLNNPKTFTSDGILQKINITKTLTADSLLSKTVTKAFLADALIGIGEIIVANNYPMDYVKYGKVAQLTSKVY